MDFMGASMALPAAILGGAQGQIGSLINKWLDYKYRLRELDDKALQDARDSKGKSFLFTRRLLALMTGVYIFGGPLIAAYLSIPVIVFYSESNGFFSALFSGSFTIKMINVEGFVLSPVHTYLASFTWAMYFGGKRV